MKIGFDVSDLCTGRADGTTRYTRELVKNMLTEPLAWHLFAPCPRRDGVARVNWHASPQPLAWTQARLPWDLYRVRPDVLFMPIQQLPYVRPGGMKTVAVIHDLAVHRYPEQFRYKDWALLHVFSAYVARQADLLIAVSQATADDVAHYYGRAEGVQVVHHGVDHDMFFVPDEAKRVLSWNYLTESYAQLKRPYVLYVGQLQPRKNLGRLIDAFALLKKSHPDLQLVLAGGHGWLKDPIFKAAARSPFARDIILPGVIPDDLLPALYWHAEVFVLPSLYEGFGMPIVEAMASGCPVVTSDVSSMPEVAGGAAVLINPLAATSLASGIEQALADQETLRGRGVMRAKQFSWEATARQTRDVLLAAAA